MKIILITITLLLLLSGCTTHRPSITEYKIVTKNSATSSSVDGCKMKSLKVAQAFSSNVLMSLKMDYTLPNNKVFSYSQSQWNESPNHMITQEILKNTRGINIFKDVQISKSRSKSNLILETNIEDFMQYYTQDLKKSYAVIVLSFTLIDSKANTVVATKTLNSKVYTKTPDADGGVEALNRAIDDILSQHSEWLNGVCK